VKLAGVLPILQTPFLDDGRLDIGSLRRMARHVCDNGVAGVAFPGFVSEWWKLSDAEILLAAAILREETLGRAGLILNVTAQSTYGAARQALEFAELGCDALMCLPPFVVPAGADDSLRHLRRLLEITEIPFVLQYSASLTGLSLEPAQIAELQREFPHLQCVKVDFIPPGPMITRLVEALPEMSLLVGFAGLQLPDSLRRGARGLMGGAGHVAEDVAVFAALERDPEAGRELFHALLPLLNFEMQTVGHSVAVHKRLLYEKGVIDSDHVRAPGRPLDSLEIEELHRVLEASAVLRRARA
jgi:4-hydroxy-tetrahydrodipicolinate synthase